MMSNFIYWTIVRPDLENNKRLVEQECLLTDYELIPEYCCEPICAGCQHLTAKEEAQVISCDALAMGIRDEYDPTLCDLDDTYCPEHGQLCNAGYSCCEFSYDVDGESHCSDKNMETACKLNCGDLCYSAKWEYQLNNEKEKGTNNNKEKDNYYTMSFYRLFGHDENAAYEWLENLSYKRKCYLDTVNGYVVEKPLGNTIYIALAFILSIPFCIVIAFGISQGLRYIYTGLQHIGSEISTFYDECIRYKYVYNAPLDDDDDDVPEYTLALKKQEQSVSGSYKA